MQTFVITIMYVSFRNLDLDLGNNITSDWINLISSQSEIKLLSNLENCCLTHSHTMTPFDAPGKKAF